MTLIEQVVALLFVIGIGVISFTWGADRQNPRP